MWMAGGRQCKRKLTPCQVDGNSWAGNGQEMEEGSDGVVSEIGELGSTGELEDSKSNEEWNINQSKKKKNNKSDCGASASLKDGGEQYKVFVKLGQEGTTFREWNPIQLTKGLTLSKEIGEVRSAKILRNGQLLVFCKSEEQLKKAVKMSKIHGKPVQCSKANDKKLVRGVITGIPVNVQTDAIIANIKHVKVCEAKRLKTKRFGDICDSLSVMLTFEGETLPDKVFVGFMSYMVKLYIPPPLRCYKCQRFGHIAAVCKGKKRCSMCGRDHDYDECDKVRKQCCNCGGEHSAAYQGCEFSKRAKEVQRIKVTEGISYSEAVKMVPRVNVIPKQNEGIGNDTINEEDGEISKDNLVVSKHDFVIFMVEIINCSAQTTSRTERIKIIVKAAEKYLGIKGMDWETVRDNLSTDIQSTQHNVGIE